MYGFEVGKDLGEEGTHQVKLFDDTARPYGPVASADELILFPMFDTITLTSDLRDSLHTRCYQIVSPSSSLPRIDSHNLFL